MPPTRASNGLTNNSAAPRLLGFLRLVMHRPSAPALEGDAGGDDDATMQDVRLEITNRGKEDGGRTALLLASMHPRCLTEAVAMHQRF